jgi:hypothetical protein
VKLTLTAALLSREQQPTSAGGETNEEPEVKTMESLEEALKDSLQNGGPENVYLELPKLDLNKIIVPNAEIHDKCKEYWGSWMEEQGAHVPRKSLVKLIRSSCRVQAFGTERSQLSGERV